MVPIEAVNTAATAANTAVSTISMIFDRYEKWKRIKSETHSLVRLLYLEVNKNLELLEIVNFKQKKTIDYTDPDLGFIIGNFETEVIEMIFMGDEKDNLYKFLQVNGRIKVNAASHRSRYKYENVLQAVCFVYVKMDLLRKLSSENTPNELIKGVKIKERLMNVLDRLWMIKQKLEELDEIQPIARKIALANS